MKITSPTKKKVLLLLGAGIALGLEHSPRRQAYIFKKAAREWKNIDRQYLYRIVREFKYERLVAFEENEDGMTKIVLTEKGKKMALSFDIDSMELKTPDRWDGVWRVVFFDIPEKKRYARDILREKLKHLGFREIQKSMLIFPHPCLSEINFIIEYYQLRKYVRCGEMKNISNEAELKIKFDLV
jgi:DNA-binding transcriptional regulator PaaX